MSAAALSHGLEKAELLVVEGIKAARLGNEGCGRAARSIPEISVFDFRAYFVTLRL
jgi:hypothetical protein